MFDSPADDLSFGCNHCHQVVKDAAAFEEHKRQCQNQPKKSMKSMKNDLLAVKKSIRHQASVISTNSTMDYQRRLSFC